MGKCKEENKIYFCEQENVEEKYGYQSRSYKKWKYKRRRGYTAPGTRHKINNKDGHEQTTYSGTNICRTNEQEQNKGRPYWHSLGYKEICAHDTNQRQLTKPYWQKKKGYNRDPGRIKQNSRHKSFESICNSRMSKRRSRLCKGAPRDAVRHKNNKKKRTTGRITAHWLKLPIAAAMITMVFIGRG
eukprot:9110114-Heterocapsa_arctica.AAC.1